MVLLRYGKCLSNVTDAFTRSLKNKRMSINLGILYKIKKNMKAKYLIKRAYIMVIFTCVFACNNSKVKEETIGLKNAATFPIGLQ